MSKEINLFGLWGCDGSDTERTYGPTRVRRSR
jgi:hypothetical protein